MTSVAPSIATRSWTIAPGRSLVLDRPRLLAILNVTTDSFSGDGVSGSPEAALDLASSAIKSGAAIIDIGGESTRPGAQRVSADEQIRRVVPIIRMLRDAGADVPISIDTTRSQVARAALDAGAQIINDVSAGTEDADMLPLAAESGCGLILMHRLQPPSRDRYSDQYADEPDYSHEPDGVVGAVRTFLADRAEAAIDAGVDPSSIVLDPGLGFGKSVAQNFELVRRTPDLLGLGFPVLSAASRKSFIGAVTGVESPAQRAAGSVAISVAHWLMGVRLFRVHDVAAHAQALALASRLGF